MTTYRGNLRKMMAVLHTPLEYHLLLADHHVELNPLLGQTIQLRYTGEIHCVHCHKKTNKSFQQGHCFPCYRRLLECNLCVIHPEKCRYYEGNCKADDWAHAHCGQPHIIYIANSSALKVGITQATHIPTRWIDQGATQGLALMAVMNRHQSGLVEVSLKSHIADKTHWQKMLKAANTPQDLIAKKQELRTQAGPVIEGLINKFSPEIQWLEDAEGMDIDYPVLAYPEKVIAFNFDKNPEVTGVLQGIKGQYLLLDTGVLCIRKFSGYGIELSF